MTLFHHWRPGRIAVVVSGAILLCGNTGLAQSVRMFDDAPSIEQLRSIMVPESQGGGSRTIVIQRPDTSAFPNPVQPASTQPAQPQPRRETISAAAPRPAQPAATQTAAASPPVQAAEAGAVAFHISFAFNSAVLPDSAHVMIDRIAQLMKEAPQLKLRVEGHTDATGRADYNVSLSEARADSVAQYLVSHGIARDRLILVGKGKSEPLTPDPYDAANRRVQFVRIG